MSFQGVAIDPLGGLCWPGGEDISPTKIPQYGSGREGKLDGPVKSLQTYIDNTDP